MTPLPRSRTDPSDAGPPSPERLRRPLSLVVHRGPAEDSLIRRLALDRLRELHDDGVTVAYIGRMYGVEAERIRGVERRLRLQR